MGPWRGRGRGHWYSCALRAGGPLPISAAARFPPGCWRIEVDLIKYKRTRQQLQQFSSAGSPLRSAPLDHISLIYTTEEQLEIEEKAALKSVPSIKIKILRKAPKFDQYFARGAKPEHFVKGARNSPTQKVASSIQLPLSETFFASRGQLSLKYSVQIRPEIPEILAIPETLLIREIRPKISEIRLENFQFWRKTPKILENLSKNPGIWPEIKILKSDLKFLTLGPKSIKPDFKSLKPLWRSTCIPWNRVPLEYFESLKSLKSVLISLKSLKFWNPVYKPYKSNWPLEVRLSRSEPKSLITGLFWCIPWGWNSLLKEFFSRNLDVLKRSKVLVTLRCIN